MPDSSRDFNSTPENWEMTSLPHRRARNSFLKPCDLELVEGLDRLVYEFKLLHWDEPKPPTQTESLVADPEKGSLHFGLAITNESNGHEKDV